VPNISAASANVSDSLAIAASNAVVVVVVVVVVANNKKKKSFFYILKRTYMNKYGFSSIELKLS